MEQIYYTQCPIGYGLGASNGYQIKRMTEAYPLAGDFRHLGVKAFPGGGRTLAPAVLRYRRDGEAAEVARLTPRAQEYHTERGVWGRPGGVFAHGLRLDAPELGSFGNWPAGLFDNPGWRTTDPEPTRGRAPDAVDLAALGSFRPAEFAAVAPLVEGEDPAWLARVWTALAQVTREGRTLFLIDEPDRLARSIALLTYGLPAALRADLTFSTFHDRPEELPGYRIQGTSPVVRPNRPALLAQGIIADRLTGTIEPAVEPARWAATLAGWFTRRDAVDEADWSSTEARARQARRPGDAIELTWADAWLDPLIGFPGAERSRARPASAADWVRLGDFARWAGRAGLADEWLRRRGADWWLDQGQAADPTGEDAAARAALVAHATLRDAWRGGAEAATGWGGALAAWFGRADRGERDDAVAAVFTAAPKSARPSFAQGLLRGLSAEAGASTLARLRANPAADRAMLLPLEAGVAATVIVAAADRFEAGDDPARVGLTDATTTLARLVADAAQFPGVTAATLGAVAALLAHQPRSAAVLAGAVAGAFDLDASTEGREALAWALRGDATAPTWLAPALRPRLADVKRGEVFDRLRDRVAPDLWPRLARAVLAVAADPGLPDDAFRLAVERILLPLAPRPNEAAWAETYLRRTPSTWDLFRRLYSKESAAAGLPAWIDSARGRGEISPEQGERIDSIRRFARSLSSGDPHSLLESPIPTGSGADRAQFFRQMLGRLGGDHLEGLPVVLDACRTAWPGAFDPRAPGLRGLAKPLAERLALGKQSPKGWLEGAEAILDRLGLTTGGRGFEPDGLLAEVVAALPVGLEGTTWPLRQFLFEDDRAWPTLAVLIQSDFAQVAPADAPELANRWDQRIVKATEARVGRFWELVLNAADPPRLASIVAARAKDLQSLGRLRWWQCADHPGATDDLRDAYARTVPLAPLPTGRLGEVDRWLAGSTRQPLNLDEPIPMVDSQAEPIRLSPLGADRWRCLKALTEYRPTTRAPSSAREATFQAWEIGLPLASLTRDDGYRFLGWIILGVDPTDAPRTTERLAGWLARSGLGDPRRVSRWADELPVEVSAQDQMDRASFVGTFGREFRTLAEEAKGRKAAKGPTNGAN